MRLAASFPLTATRRLRSRVDCSNGVDYTWLSVWRGRMLDMASATTGRKLV